MITLEYLKQKQQELNELMEQYTNEQKQKEIDLISWITEDNNDIYYYINSDGEIYETEYNEKMQDNLNLFSNKKKPEEISFRQFAHRVIEKWRDINDLNWSNSNWKDIDKIKYCIGYDYKNKELIILNSKLIKTINEIAFSTDQLAEQCIKEHKSLLEKYFNIE